MERHTFIATAESSASHSDTLTTDKTYMTLAKCISNESTAVRLKVGAVIVNQHHKVIATGFNHLPYHLAGQSCEVKNSDGSLTTRQEVIHAEASAIAYCARNAKKTHNSTLYVTTSPCIECAKLIITSGIQRVVYGSVYRSEDGLNLLKSTGIIVEQLSID